MSSRRSTTGWHKRGSDQGSHPLLKLRGHLVSPGSHGLHRDTARPPLPLSLALALCVCCAFSFVHGPAAPEIISAGSWLGPGRLFTGHFRSLTSYCVDLSVRRHTRSEERGSFESWARVGTGHTLTHIGCRAVHIDGGANAALPQYQRAAASLRPSATRPHCALHTTHSHVRTYGAHRIERPGAAGRCACAKRSEEPGHALPCVSARLAVGHSRRSSPPPETGAAARSVAPVRGGGMAEE